MIGVKRNIRKFSNLQKGTYFVIILTLILLVSIGVPTLSRYKNRNTIINAPVWDGSVASSYRKGNGTENNPYIISNGSELAYFATQLLNQDYSNTYFALSNDIILNNGIFKYDSDNGIQYIIDKNIYYLGDYSDKYYENNDRDGTEIGNVNLFSSLNGFKGNFDGRSFTIYGLYITDENNSELALFTNLEGNIKDLYVENALIYGGTITGGIASTTNNASIENVLFNGYVIGKSTNLTKQSNINPTMPLINVENTETNGYIDLTNNIPFRGAEIISTKITGNYTINGSDENETTLKVNGIIVTGGSFDINLGSNILTNIPVWATTTSSEEVTITFSNLNYQIVYNYAVSGGIIAHSRNTTITNSINKADIYGYSVSGGLVGVTTDLIDISQSYNNGNIISDNVGGGLVGAIEKSFNTITISKSYNSGVIDASNSGGLIGFINNNSGVININKTFDVSATYSIDTINNSTVNVVDSYFVNGGGSVRSGTINGSFIYTSLNNLQSKNYVVNNLLFNEFIDFNNLENNEDNVWLYEEDSLPILFIDDINKPIASIHAGIYSWNNLSSKLTPLRFTSNITFDIKEVDELKPHKERYYYISDSLEPLSKEELSEIDTWIPYDTIVQIVDEGVYIIYVKVVDYDDNITYLNSDLLILDSTGPSANIYIDNYSWNNLRSNLNLVYIGKPKSLKVEVEEDLSGISSIEYLISDQLLDAEDLNANNDWTTYTDEILIDEVGKQIVYVKLVDDFGYTTYLNTDYIIFDGYQLTSLILGRNTSSYESTNLYMTNKSSATFNFTFNSSTDDLNNHTHNLITNILLPLGTKITLIDNIANKVYSYQITTASDIYNYNDSCDVEDLDCEKKATYPFTLFKEVGSINNHFVEDSYYDDGTVNENFTIVLDFSKTNIETNYNDVLVSLELRDENDICVRPTLYSTLKNLNIYSNVGGEDTKAKLSLSSDYDGTEIIYNTDSTTNIDITSKIDYKYINEFRIIDTTYEDKKMGLAIKLIDSEGNIVDKKHLRNMMFKVGEKQYYPENDNIVRINLNSGIDEVTKTLTIVMQEDNTTLKVGTYYLKISNYASYDGNYYQELGEDEITIPVIVTEDNSNIPYSFDVIIDDNNRIIRKDDEEVEMIFKILQSGSFDNPNVRVALYKKNELTAYNQNYSLVDLSQYVSNNLNIYGSNVYYASTNPISYDGTINSYNNFVLNLITTNFENTGYKFVFTLYDGDTKIGTIEKYFIVK